MGRFVGGHATFQSDRDLPALLYSNGFDGQYLCRHQLQRGMALHRSACFRRLDEGDPAWGEALQLEMPAWLLLRYLWQGVASDSPLPLVTVLACILMTVCLGRVRPADERK